MRRYSVRNSQRVWQGRTVHHDFWKVITSTLSNPRHELFAQHLASGKSATAIDGSSVTPLITIQRNGPVNPS
jgi:hypothetical protein